MRLQTGCLAALAAFAACLADPPPAVSAEAGEVVLRGSDTVRIEPRAGARLAGVGWSVDGAVLPLDGASLDLATLRLAVGRHVLRAEVTETVSSRRGRPVARTRSWTVEVHPVGDLDLDFDVDTDDLRALLDAWGPCGCDDDRPCPADLDGTCEVTVDDLLILLDDWGAAPAS